MNTKSIGPNLFLAPEADPGDHFLDIVLVSASDREKFAQYVLHKINGEEMSFECTRYKGQSIQLCWEGSHIHVDDEVIKLKKEQEIKVEMKEGLLQFLVP